MGADNFIPPAEPEEPELPDPDAAAAAAAVDAMIAALPPVEEVSLLEDMDAVARARRAYGDLSAEAKELVQNLSALKVLEASEALAGYYTLADLGIADVSGQPAWTPFSGNLRDPMSGTVVFKASGLEGTADGYFYISLFQDPTADRGQSGDGIAIWMLTGAALPQNSTNTNIYFNEANRSPPIRPTPSSWGTRWRRTIPPWACPSAWRTRPARSSWKAPRTPLFHAE